MMYSRDKESFPLETYYGKNREKIDRRFVEQTQLGMGPGESIAYDNKQSLVKVFDMHYSDYNRDGELISHDYAPILDIYKKRHSHRSTNDIVIDAKKVSWGDLMLYKSLSQQESPIHIKKIILKTLSLDDTIITEYPEHRVCVLSNIPYIDGISLQSLCDRSRNKGISLQDTRDQRSIRCGAEEVYQIGYAITQYVNNLVYKNYGVWGGKIGLSLKQYGRLGLVPKNIKVASIDQTNGVLECLITDRFSSIMLWYIYNSREQLFNNFISSGALQKQDPTLQALLAKNIKHIVHRINRLYVHT